MTIEVDVRLDGAQNVRGNLRKVRVRAGRRIVSPMTRAVAMDVAASARRTRSFRDRTGRLRRSIRVSQVRATGTGGRGRFREGWAVVAGGISRGIIYAPFIEFGTRYIRARRFITRALMRQRRRALSTMSREGRKGLRRAAR